MAFIVSVMWDKENQKFLKNTDYNIEKSLVQLGSINPLKYIFSRVENSYAKIASG
jgi:hypothetical protein